MYVCIHMCTVHITQVEIVCMREHMVHTYLLLVDSVQSLRRKCPGLFTCKGNAHIVTHSYTQHHKYAIHTSAIKILKPQTSAKIIVHFTYWLATYITVRYTLNMILCISVL